MTGDFARVTFDPLMRFTQVLQNQGRVNLEADWNEQGAIVLHLLRTLIVDLGGSAWRPGHGFDLEWDAANTTLTIADGHFFVDGILCENDEKVTYATQPWRPLPEGDPDQLAQELGLVFLDAWERHVTSIEVPQLREVALNGVDTTSRAQVVWQVRVWNVAAINARVAQIDAALETRCKTGTLSGPTRSRPRAPSCRSSRI